MNGLLWVIVGLIALAILIGVVLFATMRKRRAPFEVRPVPENYVGAYQGRMDELERLFVSQPREAVAGARLLVDDLMTRMNYPVRVNEQERLHDLRHQHKNHMERYKSGLGLKDNATTEQLRRALRNYLEMAHELLQEGAGKARKKEETGSRRLAG